MGFIGALPPEVRRVIGTYASEIRLPVINVCAGNFTIPSVLRSAGFAGDIYACDVTLFTSALGAALTDAPLPLRLRPDAPAPFGELVDLSTPENAFASIALLYDLHMVWKMKNPFQARQVEGYRRNWPQLVAKAKEKLAAYKSHLAGVRYAARDGFEVLKEADPAHTIIAAPPIYKGGYERLDELINRCVEWTPPPYKPMLDTDLEPYALISRFEDYLVVLYKDLPEVYKLLGEPVAAILPKGRASYVMRIIAKRGPRLVLRPETRSQPVGPFLPPGYRITGREKLTAAPIMLAQSIRMNQLFSSARVNTFTGGTDLSLAFMLDGMIFGKCDFCKSAHDWKFPDIEGVPKMVYLMSDLVVPSETERLAKLVLLCVLSRDVKQALDLKLTDDHRIVGTTAFSPHPESMKYRGIFKMHKRTKEKGKDGYKLNYFAPFGGNDLKKTLGIWFKKHGPGRPDPGRARPGEAAAQLAEAGSPAAPAAAV